MDAHRFGDFLVQKKHIHPDELRVALEYRELHFTLAQKRRDLRIGSLVSGVMGCMGLETLCEDLEEHLNSVYKVSDIKTTGLLSYEIDFGLVYRFLHHFDDFQRYGFFPMRFVKTTAENPDPPPDERDSPEYSVLVACMDPLIDTLPLENTPEQNEALRTKTREIRRIVSVVLDQYGGQGFHRKVRIVGLVAPQYRLIDVAEGLRFVITLGEHLLRLSGSTRPIRDLRDIVARLVHKDFNEDEYRYLQRVISRDFPRALSAISTTGGGSRIELGILNTIATLISSPEDCVPISTDYIRLQGPILRFQGFILKCLFHAITVHSPLLPRVASFPVRFQGDEVNMYRSFSSIEDQIAEIQPVVNHDFLDIRNWLEWNVTLDDELHVFGYSCLLLRNFFEFLRDRPALRVVLIGNPVQDATGTPFAWRTYCNVEMLRRSGKIVHVETSQYGPQFCRSRNAKLLMGAVHYVPQSIIQPPELATDSYLCCEKGALEVFDRFGGHTRWAVLGRSKEGSFFQKIQVRQLFEKVVRNFRLYTKIVEDSHVLIPSKRFNLIYPTPDFEPTRSGMPYG